MTGRRVLWWRTYDLLARLLATVNRVPIGERSVTIDGDRLYARSVDRLLALWSWRLGAGEREERELIARVVQPGMTAVDVGANVGLHTLGLARRVGAGGRVHALEPDPENFRLLERAVQQARYPNVSLHRAAAAATRGALTLYVSAANRGDHRTAPAAEPRRSFRVDALPLDELLAPEARVDFLKIDVQGAEVDVFRGFTRTLARSPRMGILAELCPELLRRAGASERDLFESLPGFSPHRILAGGALDPIGEAAAIELAERQGYLNLYFSRRS